MKLINLLTSVTCVLLSGLSYAADHSQDNVTAQALYQNFLQNTHSNAMNDLNVMYNQLPSSNPFASSANSSNPSGASSNTNNATTNSIAPTSG